jgi:glutamyl-tRNA synthetase
MGTLTLSSKLSPFPFAAIAIASYTQKATLDFDQTANGITLDLNGSKITSEDEIVHALAKAGGLSGDSAKVTQERSNIDVINSLGIS